MTLKEFEARLDALIDEFWHSDECQLDPYQLAEFIKQYADGIEFRYEFGGDE